MLGGLTSDCTALVQAVLGDGSDDQRLFLAVGLLRDEDRGVRGAAVETLGRIGNMRALPHLEKVAKEDVGETFWGKKVADAAKDAMDRIRAAQQKDEERPDG